MEKVVNSTDKNEVLFDELWEKYKANPTKETMNECMKITFKKGINNFKKRIVKNDD